MAWMPLVIKARCWLGISLPVGDHVRSTIARTRDLIPGSRSTTMLSGIIIDDAFMHMRHDIEESGFDVACNPLAIMSRADNLVFFGSSLSNSMKEAESAAAYWGTSSGDS